MKIETDSDKELKDFLDQNVERYNNRSFIEKDPISIPHDYSLKQDIEIMGFFASVFAWGQRVSIINKCRELGERMDGAPYQFIKQHEESDLKILQGFKHRTFNDFDLLYFIDFLKRHYSVYDSLEDAFILELDADNIDIKNSLTVFHNYFFKDIPGKFRTRKHIPTPANKSACKRLNMFLRWMVRKDDKGVDFGIWNKIQPRHLICPLDVHVDRTARILGLIERRQTDWLTAEELTMKLRLLDADDPVKYDFALFGLSVGQKAGGFEQDSE